ncbi:MAG: hypothetical protein A3K03_13925 [Bdellovibrionales bacterium RIFOXYD1_FULL_44_7]|nr:MAG: hypothetical protein A3K03_13925 [Bdellovibrionales bacterium RIFOXYD1_FULL_44_7]
MRNDFSPLAKVLGISLVSCLCLYRLASATPLQIIHTNDLHSHFEKGENPTRGHYAAVKAVIDRLKADADDKIIETLVVDSGDFSEGSQFYLADKGELSWKAMNLMGYDAVVLGNHDYLAGPLALDRILKNASPDFFLLGANVKNKNVRPRARIERNGDWVSIIGLTTDSPDYSWRLGEKLITSPKKSVEKLVPKYRKDSHFVIALSHLGLSADRKLVRETKGIDLIIGGHSHDALYVPVFEPAKDGAKVPIVQAGQNGEYVGDLLVDLVPGKPVKILRYQLIPVDIDGPKDAEMLGFVEEARRRLEKNYPAPWLYQQIAYSEVPVLRPENGKSVWGDIIGKGMLLVSKAHLAINSADLFGDNLPAGPITRETLMQYFPRVFEFQPVTLGWTVWSAEVEGFVLKRFLQEAIRRGLDVSLSGGSLDIKYKNGSPQISNFKVRGKKACNFCVYKIALPEGIARVVGNDYYLQRLLDDIKSTRYSMWTALELQLKKMGGIVKTAASE